MWHRLYLQIEYQGGQILDNQLVAMSHMEAIESSESWEVMDDIGKDWHESVISLPLVTVLVDDILELSVVKDIKSLDSSIHEILTELSHIIQERTYVECVLPVPCHVLNGSNDQHDEEPDHD